MFHLFLDLRWFKDFDKLFVYCRIRNIFPYKGGIFPYKGGILGKFVLALISPLLYLPPLCFYLSAWADGTWSSRDPPSKPRDVQQSNEKLQTRNGKTWSWLCEFFTYYIKKTSLRIFRIKQCIYSGKREDIFG